MGTHEKKSGPTFTRREVLAGSAVAVAAAGCPGPLPGVDAGGAADAGTLSDGGLAAPDAGQTLDAGLDAGAPDAASSPDAGADAGLAPDGGLDAGAPGPDGGDFADGGAPDAAADDAGVDPDHPAAIAPSPEFPLGVATGPGQSGGVVFWTRYDGPNDIALCYWPAMDPSGYTLQPMGPADLSPLMAGQRAFVAHPELLPGVRYEYTFVELDLSDPAVWLGRSDVGQVRIPALGGSDKVVRIGAHSCTNAGETNFNVLDAAGSLTDLDAYILVGDTVYADGAVTRAEYDQFWDTAFRTNAYRDIRRRNLLLATWDDHEVDNNWNPETFDPTNLANATDAFFAHQPLDPVAADPQRIWRSQRFGNVLEVFVLDCRSERLPSTRQTEDAIYISTAQMDWLKTGLANSPCTFKLIVNSVPIADQPLALGAADQWSGYAAQRDEILDFIDTAPFDGVIWLAGDIHMSATGRIGAPGDQGAGQIEVISSGAAKAVGNPRAFLFNGPQWDWATAQRAFVTLSFQPLTGQVTVTHLAEGLGVMDEHTYTIATL